jgi:hypothetical protein
MQAPKVTTIGRPGNHALGMRGCETSVDQLDQQPDRKAVREQDRLGPLVLPASNLRARRRWRLGVGIGASGHLDVL